METKTNDFRFVNGKLQQKVIVTPVQQPDDTTIAQSTEEWREVEGQ